MPAADGSTASTNTIAASASTATRGSTAPAPEWPSTTSARLGVVAAAAAARANEFGAPIAPRGSGTVVSTPLTRSSSASGDTDSGTTSGLWTSTTRTLPL